MLQQDGVVVGVVVVVVGVVVVGVVGEEQEECSGINRWGLCQAATMHIGTSRSCSRGPTYESVHVCVCVCSSIYMCVCVCMSVLNEKRLWKEGGGAHLYEASFFFF